MRANPIFLTCSPFFVYIESASYFRYTFLQFSYERWNDLMGSLATKRTVARTAALEINKSNCKYGKIILNNVQIWHIICVECVRVPNRPPSEKEF
jgi:hypothetical protein